MGAFVYSDPSNGFKLQVSPEFWVYFVVVAPMTVVLLVAWAVWINRRQLLSQGNEEVRRVVPRLGAAADFAYLRTSVCNKSEAPYNTSGILLKPRNVLLVTARHPSAYGSTPSWGSAAQSIERVGLCLVKC
jgi:hypothetical protein